MELEVARRKGESFEGLVFPPSPRNDRSTRNFNLQRTRYPAVQLSQVINSPDVLSSQRQLNRIPLRGAPGSCTDPLPGQTFNPAVQLKKCTAIECFFLKACTLLELERSENIARTRADSNARIRIQFETYVPLNSNQGESMDNSIRYRRPLNDRVISLFYTVIKILSCLC